MAGEGGPQVAGQAPVVVGSSRQGTVLALVTLSSFFVPFMSSATNVALPQIARELDIDAPTLSWVNTAFMLASAVLLLPLGRLVDMHGKRMFFVAGVAAFAVASVLVGVAPSEGWLLALRAVQGMAGAVPLAAAMPLLVSVYPPAQRGRAIGINIAGVYTGLSCGPVVGGFLVQQLGWRSIFYLPASLALVIAVVGALRLPRDHAVESTGRFDGVGSALYGLSLCALMLGMGRLPAPVGWMLLGASAVGFAGFTVWELRSDSPLLDVRLMGRNPVFLFSNIAALVNYCSTAATGFLLSLYLQHVQGFDPRGAGLVLMVQPVLMAVLSGPVGRLSDRVEPRVLATSGMALTMVGLIILIPISTTTPVWVVLVALAILGVAFALFSSPNTSAVMGAVERRHLGIASATLGTMRSVGQMLSLGISGLLFALFIGPVQVDHTNLDAFLNAMHVAFGLFAAMCFAGTFASFARGKVQRAQA